VSSEELLETKARCRFILDLHTFPFVHPANTAQTGVPRDTTLSLAWETGVPTDTTLSLGWETGVPRDSTLSLGWEIAASTLRIPKQKSTWTRPE